MASSYRLFLFVSEYLLYSRVLTVGGLPEGTPLSIVIEAFEKQGKIEVRFCSVFSLNA